MNPARGIHHHHHPASRTGIRHLPFSLSPSLTLSLSPRFIIYHVRFFIPFCFFVSRHLLPWLSARTLAPCIAVTLDLTSSLPCPWSQFPVHLYSLIAFEDYLAASQGIPSGIPSLIPLAICQAPLTPTPLSPRVSPHHTPRLPFRGQPGLVHLSPRSHHGVLRACRAHVRRSRCGNRHGARVGSCMLTRRADSQLPMVGATVEYQRDLAQKCFITWNVHTGYDWFFEYM